MKVAVLSGGRSGEHDVSLVSGTAVAAGLAEAGHEVVEIRIGRDGRWIGPDGADVEVVPAGGLLGCDAVFPALHGPYGEDGTVQGMLDVLDVPYVGSSVLASATAIDKLGCKRLLAWYGMPQADFVGVGDEGWREHAAALPRPLWVKPSRLGSSVGISRVDDPEAGDALDLAVALALEHDPRVIIEAHVEGRELEVGLLGDGDDLLATAPGELIVHADWYDYAAKYEEGGMELAVPAPVDASVVAAAQELAKRVFRAVGASGLARCDLFLSPSGELLVNEINTMPGFTPTSVYARLVEAAGIPYPELCDRLVRIAVIQ